MAASAGGVLARGGYGGWMVVDAAARGEGYRDQTDHAGRSSQEQARNRWLANLLCRIRPWPHGAVASVGFRRRDISHICAASKCQPLWHQFRSFFTLDLGVRGWRPFAVLEASAAGWISAPDWRL